MRAFALAELVLLVGLVFAVATGAVFSRLVPTILAHTDKWAPERRHTLLLLFSLSPLALTFTCVMAVLLPGLMALAWPHLDHCLAHDDHHLHLCFVHLPAHAANTGAFITLGLATAWLSWKLMTGLLEVGKAFRLVSKLRRLGAWNTELQAQVLPTAQPICLLSGLLHPTVVVSQGFLTATTPAELDVALQHERAHGRRRDIVCQLMARSATVLLWYKPRAHLLQALSVAAERSCDESAAQQTGSRLQVAEAILKVERLLHCVPLKLTSAVASFGSNAVPQRVTALLEPPNPTGRVLPWSAGFALLLLTTVGLHHPLHHFAESLIAVLAH